jgi:phage I-like protein
MSIFSRLFRGFVRSLDMRPTHPSHWQTSNGKGVERLAKMLVLSEQQVRVSQQKKNKLPPYKIPRKRPIGR